MATMSIGKAWQEAVAFVAREAALLFPVALLFVALPGLILQEMAPPELAGWTPVPGQPVPDVPASFAMAMLLAVLIIWFGSLALFALALRPGISVAEALRLSVSRLPVLVGTALLVVGAMLGIALVGVVAAGLLSALSKSVGAALLALVVGGLVGAALFASIRLLLLNPVVIDGHAGVMDSLRQAWALSQGHFWRLLGFIIILTLLSMIASTAAQLIAGLIGNLIGGPEGARLAGSLAAAAVSTLIQVYMLVMLARLYVQAMRS